MDAAESWISHPDPVTPAAEDPERTATTVCPKAVKASRSGKTATGAYHRTTAGRMRRGF